MNRGEKLRSKRNIKALDRSKVNIPIYEPTRKVNRNIIGWYSVTNFKQIRL